MNTRPPAYDRQAVQPLRKELTQVGVRELLTPEDVDAVLSRREGTVLLVVNSVCGCAAGGARPGVMQALQHRVIPDELATVFAGMEHEAVERARSYLTGYPPSSPSIALLKDGEVAMILERHEIERLSPEDIARELKAAFDRFCCRPGPSIPQEQFEKIVPQRICGSQIPPFSSP